MAARAEHPPSQVTRIEDPAEPKALRNPKYYKYQALLPRIVAFIELDRKSRSKNYDHPPQIGTIVGSEQLGTRGVLSEEVAYIGLPIKPQFKQNIERTYKEMQGKHGFVWGKQQLYSVPQRSETNTVPMAPYANVTNCGYLPTNRPDYNQAGPVWYHQPDDGAQNKVNYTLESIRRVHSQTHRLLRVSNHTARESRV